MGRGDSGGAVAKIEENDVFIALFELRGEQRQGGLVVGTAQELREGCGDVDDVGVEIWFGEMVRHIHRCC